MKFDLSGLFRGLLLAAVLALPGHAATVSVEATDVAAFVQGDPAVRFRAQNAGNELYVGVGDLATPKVDRLGVGLTYVAEAAFSVSYNATTGLVYAIYNGVGKEFRTTPGQIFDALLIEITGPRRQKGLDPNYFGLTGLTVNGEAIPDMLGAVVLPKVSDYWVVSDFATTGVVTLSGVLHYSFSLADAFSPPPAEAARVQFRFGNMPPVPLPAALPLMLLALGGLGLAARRRRGA